jgi:hypothetical protein
MGKRARIVNGTIGGCAVLALSVSWFWQGKAGAGEAKPSAPAYVGAKECAACHFDQFLEWLKTKHAKEAYSQLPAKYKTDAQCLKCHATGHGLAGGFTGPETPGLAGVACEACHGPGGAHAQAAAKDPTKTQLSAEDKKRITSAISRTPATRVCASCHVDSFHVGKGQEHPKYDK